ncbi:SDR family oxidoreductase [Rubrivivax sp. RP6-9]|uniref:SDR family oxidoreductase n=1 Tax=Rubrivivax sp. RP6-9 TaxID=3415750 RepID=UPI003CC617AB
MRVFVTGATGFVGSAVVQELRAAGHQVLGLARSEAAAGRLAAAGAAVLQGSLEDPGSLQQGAQLSDAVIHAAFNHDFTRFADNCVLDQQAIRALGQALQGSDRPLIVTAGLARLAPGRLAVEADAQEADPAYPRVSEATALQLVQDGVKAMVLRLPPSVHGPGDQGFVPMLIGIARDKGMSVYGGDGQHLWPAVHRLDAARLFRLALEQGTAGERFHAAAEQGVAFKDIATAIGRGLGLPVVAMSPEEAEAHFGWFAMFAAMDARASSAHTRSRLGWTPLEPGLIDDIEQAGYFQS